MATAFTGQRLDASGLLYYHARMYDPVLGRFVSADTIVPDSNNPQALNRYTYVYNNPIRYRDPSGHCSNRDPECHELITSVVNQLGFTPAGISQWATDLLSTALKWLQAGVKFTSQDNSYGTGAAWTANNLEDVFTALDMVANALRDKTMVALGLGNGGSLTFNKLGCNCGAGGRAGYNNDISLFLTDERQDRAIATAIHEIGHLVDRRLGKGENWWSQTSSEWGAASGWYMDPSDRWRQTDKGRQGTVTDWSLTSPVEDFADTFRWYVYNANGQSHGRTPNKERQQALQVAIDSVP